jgi:hypothetical protein
MHARWYQSMQREYAESDPQSNARCVAGWLDARIPTPHKYHTARDCIHHYTHLVVKELDGLPLNPFCAILFLLCLERELDEDLLQLLVAVVDAELLERVGLENGTRRARELSVGWRKQQGHWPV